MDIDTFMDLCKDMIECRSRERRTNGRYDELYAILLSDNENVYVGKPFTGTNQRQFNYCAERHAINQMQLEESEDSEVVRILVAHPVPEDDDTPCYPCGACRDALSQFDNPEVISTCYTRKDEGWDFFQNLDINNLEDLHPDEYEYVNPWDE